MYIIVYIYTVLYMYCIYYACIEFICCVSDPLWTGATNVQSSILNVGLHYIYIYFVQQSLWWQRPFSLSWISQDTLCPPLRGCHHGSTNKSDCSIAALQVCQHWKNSWGNTESVPASCPSHVAYVALARWVFNDGIHRPVINDRILGGGPKSRHIGVTDEGGGWELLERSHQWDCLASLPSSFSSKLENLSCREGNIKRGYAPWRKHMEHLLGCFGCVWN